MNNLKFIIYALLLFLRWTPRILCILFTLLISLFAMDVFGQHTGFWRTFLAFLAHLTPTFLIVIILVLSWRWAWIGGITFILLGIAYIIWEGIQNPIIHVPVFIIGILFLLSWLFRVQIKEAQDAYDEG